MLFFAALLCHHMLLFVMPFAYVLCDVVVCDVMLHRVLAASGYVPAYDTSTLLSEVISVDGHNYDVICPEKPLKVYSFGGHRRA